VLTYRLSFVIGSWYTNAERRERERKRKREKERERERERPEKA